MKNFIHILFAAPMIVAAPSVVFSQEEGPESSAPTIALHVHEQCPSINVLGADYATYTIHNVVTDMHASNEVAMAPKTTTDVMVEPIKSRIGHTKNDSLVSLRYRQCSLAYKGNINNTAFKPLHLHRCSRCC